MIARGLFVTARVIAALVFLTAWAYGVTTYSPFAFDMFVRPRLFPQLTTFVEWFHAWYWLAYALSVATLMPELRSARRGAWWAALGFTIFFGAIGVYLLNFPYLATLSSDAHSLAVVPGALLPLVWLGVIDHLAALTPSSRVEENRTTNQSGLLLACVSSAAFVWAAHLVGGADRASSIVAVWTLVLDLTAFLGVYVVLSLASALADTQVRRVSSEYLLTIIVLAVAITEFWRRVVLPSFSFAASDALAISAGLAIAVCATWSGLRVRSRVRHDATGMAHALSILPAGRLSAIASVVLIAITAAFARRFIGQIDWASILHSAIAIAEAVLVFGVFLSRCSNRPQRTWSFTAMVAPPMLAMLVMLILPYGSATLAKTMRRADFEANVVVDRLAAADSLAAFTADRFIEQPSFDLSYFQQLIASESAQSTQDPAVPKTRLGEAIVPPATPPPNVFFFVIDSLRRDYLSPYNPAVTFTPAIDAWAREQFVFRNAFTKFGGTWLSMPSIWTGGAVTRGWGRIFGQINTLESFINVAGYDFVINDFTVASHLHPNPRRTFIEPEIPSDRTDLCRNLAWLQTHLASRQPDAAPVFAFLAPMNVHILNTGIRSSEGAGEYPGFYPPYASRLKRMDACFGSFLSTLQELKLADTSIIVLTSDHGDALGDDGRWGHQFYLFPETIRVPLIVQLPKAQQTTMTTDLSRVAFLTDLTPTLLNLTGQLARDPGSPYGSPLFIGSDQELQPRRRESFLLMSSYGSTYALLRRNGRFLYVSDLLNWREHAFTLFREPLGASVPVDAGIRRVNQAGILDQGAELDAFYRRH